MEPILNILYELSKPLSVLGNLLFWIGVLGLIFSLLIKRLKPYRKALLLLLIIGLGLVGIDIVLWATLLHRFIMER